MKEYAFENRPVDTTRLTAPRMPLADYFIASRSLVIPCHDVVIQYQDGALLVVRDNQPAKGLLFPIGGRIERGIPIEESLRRKVKEECNLDLSDIAELGYARAYFSTDSFGHGRGSDVINFMFYGKGTGELMLDNLHRDPVIVTPEMYTPEFRQSLHPYVKYMMDKAMVIIKRNNKSVY